MSSPASVNIKFSADLKQFSTEMQTALREIDKAGRKFKEIGTSLSTYVTLPILAFGAASVVAFDQSAQAIAQVDAALKSTGGAVGYTSEQLQKMAADLQNVTTFDDDEILKKATANLLTFSNITGETFQEAQKAALDLATRLDGDLQGAAIQVGKALNDPVKGITALSRVGVSFSASQKETIASMVATNNIAGAQSLILKELQKEFGGSAEAAAKAGAGGIKQLGNIIGDLSEDFGKIILEAIQPFIESIKSMVLYFKELSPEAKKTIVVVAGIAAAIGPLLLGIGSLLTLLPTLAAGFAVLTGPIGLVVAALAAVAYVVVNNWGPIKKTLVDVANYFVDLYNNSTVFRGAIEYIILSFKNMWATAKLSFNNIISTVSFIGNNIYNLFKTLGGLIRSVLTLDMDGFKKALSTGFSQLGDDTVSFFKKLSENGKATAEEIKDNITTALSNTLNGNEIKKIVIPADKIDATAVTKAVSEAAQAGVSGNAGRKKETGLKSDLKPAGLVGVKGAEFQLPEKINIVNEELLAMAARMEYLQEVGEKVGASVADAFSGMSSRLVESLGLAKDGFGGFIAGMIQTVTKLIAMMLASAISQSIAGATASGTATGPAAIFTTPAFIATAVGGVVAAFAAIPKFETGGVIGGSSFYGDKILARVNSGEMVANGAQQQKIWGAMQSNGGATVFIPDVKLKGNDIWVSFKRTEELKNRVG